MKKERGSITIITLVSVIFMISVLISVNVIILNREQAQAEIKRETKKIYENKVDNIENEYESYFAEESEVIPIYTAEHLLKVGTKRNIVVNNKIYRCLPTAKYILKNNINLKVSEYQKQYPEQFEVQSGAESTTWKGIQISSFDYNGKIITETDTKNNIKMHDGKVEN